MWNASSKSMAALNPISGANRRPAFPPADGCNWNALSTPRLAFPAAVAHFGVRHALMSDDYVHIIPAEAGRVPDAEKREAAVSYFRSIAPHADSVISSATDTLEFVNCGSNFGRIACPTCGAVFKVDLWNDWMNSDVGE